MYIYTTVYQSPYIYIQSDFRAKHLIQLLLRLQIDIYTGVQRIGFDYDLLTVNHAP